MKIVRLSASNVKRLTAIEVTPQGNIIKVGGKNGAGKSSVLDSIAYALGGKELVPSEPIRLGESQASVTVDLGDYLVIRKFNRDRLPCDCQLSTVPPGTDGTPHEHYDTCASRKFGETKSALVVTNKDGARYPSPQAILDKLYGKLTFDPLVFADANAKDQNGILRRLTNLDFTPLENKRKELSDERSMVSKSFKALTAQIEGMPHFPNAPAQEMGNDAITKELEDAERLRKEADAARVEHSNRVADLSVAREAVRICDNVITTTETKIIELQQRLEEEKQRRLSLVERSERLEREVTTLSSFSAETRAAVPDTASINDRIKVVENTNREVRANAIRLEKVTRATDLNKQVELLVQQIVAIDQQKQHALTTTKFPVEGLSLTDDGVTFNGIPFEQASTAEQLRVSVAIGLALNPTLRVLLIRNGNALDDDSLAAVAEQAAEADAQIWLEYVTKNDEGVQVMIEDGHLV